MTAIPKSEKTTATTKPFEMREAIKSLVSKMGKDLSKEEKKEQAKVLVKIFEKGMTPKQAMEISNEDVNLIYRYAYHLFNNGKYVEACELFKMLVILSPQESGYAGGLAACYHKMKDYEKAALLYMQQSMTDQSDPSPLMYCYDCYTKMNDPFGAYFILLSAIKRASLDPRYKKLQGKAETILAGFDLSSLTESPNIENEA